MVPPPPPPAAAAPPDDHAPSPAHPHHHNPHHHNPHRRASATSSIAGHSDLSVTDLAKLRRLGSVNTRLEYTKREGGERGGRRARAKGALARTINSYTQWAVPGLGMFSEAYIIFSIGLIGPFQEALFPDCFSGKHSDPGCSASLVHATKFIQIVFIVVGMLVGGALLDVVGRRFGSRLAAAIMTVGSVLLTFSSFIRVPGAYLGFFIFCQSLYGLGVGGEYPSASAGAAERAQESAALRSHRGQQVVLTFSQQGMGNFVNTAVILILMAMFGETRHVVGAESSRAIISIQFAVATAVAIFMLLWRMFRLKESAVWTAEHKHAGKIAEEEHIAGGAHASLFRHVVNQFWPRFVATSMAWLANDFAFYGNKLFQSQFISLLYPGATLFVRMQWTLLNSAVSLLGYYAAAQMVDRPWYGRRRMQMVGFMMLFVLFLVCGAAYPTLLASPQGLRAFQALYFLSSFFNQFGPNCVTWLVAAEVFPTEVRATLQGASAAMGKMGAILADVVFGLVDSRSAFFLSSAFGLVGALVTWLFLPDTTGMSLDELDRMSKYMLAGALEHYHGEAVAPRHLSVWEQRIWGWHTHHDPETDALHKRVQEDAALDEARASKLGSPRSEADEADDWVAAVGHAPLAGVAGDGAQHPREDSATAGALRSAGSAPGGAGWADPANGNGAGRVEMSDVRL